MGQVFPWNPQTRDGQYEEANPGCEKKTAVPQRRYEKAQEGFVSGVIILATTIMAGPSQFSTVTVFGGYCTPRRTMYWRQLHRQLLCLDIHPSTRYQLTWKIEVLFDPCRRTKPCWRRVRFTQPCTDYQDHLRPHFVGHVSTERLREV